MVQNSYIDQMEAKQLYKKKLIEEFSKYKIAYMVFTVFLLPISYFIRSYESSEGVLTLVLSIKLLTDFVVLLALYRNDKLAIFTYQWNSPSNIMSFFILIGLLPLYWTLLYLTKRIEEIDFIVITSIFSVMELVTLLMFVRLFIIKIQKSN